MTEKESLEAKLSSLEEIVSGLKRSKEELIEQVTQVRYVYTHMI